MEYKWGQEQQCYGFKALPIKGQLTIVRLDLDGKALLKKTAVSGLAQDVIALLVLGGICTDERAAAVLAKCAISQYLDNTAKLMQYVRQRYIWVSRITSGSELSSERAEKRRLFSSRPNKPIIALSTFWMVQATFNVVQRWKIFVRTAIVHTAIARSPFRAKSSTFSVPFCENFSRSRRWHIGQRTVIL